MPELTPEIRKRIDRLCQDIASSHDLDPEVSAELAGHLEDKFLAYINEEESLTEADAFVLVREHFGDPARIKSLLRSVHRFEAGAGLARRLCAVAAVQLVFLSVTALMFAIVWSVATWLLFMQFGSRLVLVLFPVVTTLTAFIGTCIFWRVLRNWRQRMLRGESLWFHRWSGLQLTVLMCALVSVYEIVPAVRGGGAGLPMPISASTHPILIYYILLVSACSVWQAGLWLWWCDTPPRRPRTLTYAALAWLLMAAPPWFVFRLVNLEMYWYDATQSAPDISGRLVLWYAQTDQASGFWTLRFGPIGDVPLAQITPGIIISIFILAVARLVYQFIRPATKPSYS